MLKGKWIDVRARVHYAVLLISDGWTVTADNPLGLCFKGNIDFYLLRSSLVEGIHCHRVAAELVRR